MVMANSFGAMVVNTTDNSRSTILRDLGTTSGLTSASTKAFGGIIK
jgi:hypothetical protein